MTAPDRRTIYVVESGEYSDYSVLCAFDREEDAQAVVSAGLGDDYREMILFAAGHLPTKRITGWEASASVYRDGNTEPPWIRADEVWDSAELVPHQQQELSGRPTARVDSGSVGTYITVAGPDRESTLKACQDRFAKILAERDGL